MIINMSGGKGASAQVVKYTNTDNLATSLSIPNVMVAGGNIRGFALMFLQQTSIGIVADEIYSIYATEANIVDRAYTVAFYKDSSSYVQYVNVLNLGYTYDKATGTFTIEGFGRRFLAGTWALMIW